MVAYPSIIVQCAEISDPRSEAPQGSYGSTVCFTLISIRDEVEIEDVVPGSWGSVDPHCPKEQSLV